MSFDSLTYLIFLPVVVLLYRSLPQRLRPELLLAASAAFYASWNLPLTLLLCAVILLTWAAGLLLQRIRREELRRWVLAAALALCVGLLLYFKYFRFLAERLQALVRLLGGGSDWSLWDVILPVGVSFYTFQSMSYVIDAFRGRVQAERSFGFYALYISFFPQLVAGPIERAASLLPQLRAARTPDREDLRQGVRMLLSGYFRKLVIADACGVFVDRVYSAAAPDGSAVLLATLLFGLQIYCDFAGYSEIARGSARLLGIRLMPNFERPYLARTIRDFWRRWHISLSKWLTDYVYIPLGGSKRGLPRQILATLAVFLLSGLWHGANDTFVVWGLLHGTLILLQLLLRRAGLREPRSKTGRAALSLLTFSLVTLLWIFFRAQSLAEALTFFGSLFSAWDLRSGLACLGMDWADAASLTLALAASPLLWRLCGEKDREHPMVYVFLLLTVALAWFVRLGVSGDSAFIYFQF